MKRADNIARITKQLNQLTTICIVMIAVVLGGTLVIVATGSQRRNLDNNCVNGTCVPDCHDGLNGTNGLDGKDGLNGKNGLNGSDGLSCWDNNQNRICDPSEDVNADGSCTVADCNSQASCTGITCTPSSVCELQTCVEGNCVITGYKDGCCTTSANCNDGNPCTLDSCTANKCVYTAQGCTNDVQCDAGKICVGCACVLASDYGVCETSSDCNDNLLCTMDICERKGSCSHLPMASCCTVDTDCQSPNYPCSIGSKCNTTIGMCMLNTIDVDGDGTPCGIDCNDTDATVYHPFMYYPDQDGDGYGNTSQGQSVCASAVPGYVRTLGDCNDSDECFFPNQTRFCVSTDMDCDGIPDRNEHPVDCYESDVLISSVTNSFVIGLYGSISSIDNMVALTFLDVPTTSGTGGWIRFVTQPSGGPGTGLRVSLASISAVTRANFEEFSTFHFFSAIYTICYTYMYPDSTGASWVLSTACKNVDTSASYVNTTTSNTRTKNMDFLEMSSNKAITYMFDTQTVSYCLFASTHFTDCGSHLSSQPLVRISGSVVNDLPAVVGHVSNTQLIYFAAATTVSNTVWSETAITVADYGTIHAIKLGTLKNGDPIIVVARLAASGTVSMVRRRNTTWTETVIDQYSPGDTLDCAPGLISYAKIGQAQQPAFFVGRYSGISTDAWGSNSMALHYFRNCNAEPDNGTWSHTQSAYNLIGTRPGSDIRLIPDISANTLVSNTNSYPQGMIGVAIAETAQAAIRATSSSST